jgi:predicted nucleic acid-binding protein
LARAYCALLWAREKARPSAWRWKQTRSAIILDDRPARRLAQALGVPIIGTLGVLLAARQRDFLPALRPSLEALAQYDFRIAPELYKQILLDAGE